MNATVIVEKSPLNWIFGLNVPRKTLTDIWFRQQCGTDISEQCQRQPTEDISDQDVTALELLR